MMSAARKNLRLLVGVIFGFAGLGVGWWLFSITLSPLSRAAKAELLSGHGFIIIAAVGTLGLIYLFGNSAMSVFDYIVKPRPNPTASSIKQDSDPGEDKRGARL